MSEIISDFIQRASLKSVADAVTVLKLRLPRVLDAGTACPACGGKDRFAVNPKKGVWNCRGAIGGKNGLGLVGHVLKLDLHDRFELLDACSVILCEAIPDGGEREDEGQRAEREARMRDALEKAEQNEADIETDRNVFRDIDVNKARGIFMNAMSGPHPDSGIMLEYLRLRTGFEMPEAIFENIRFNPRLTYWTSLKDDRGHVMSIHVGYAMIAPFVDLAGYVTGCHRTWIDLSCGPKFRPDLGLDPSGDPWPTKKMLGGKKGSLIPVFGDLHAERWVGAEGIENVAAYAGFERFREDTFYFAAGDLGNLAGPADPRSTFNHPTMTTTDKLGRVKPVRVPGPVPKPGQGPKDACQVAGHVDELILLADGDSEPVMTASAMARAQARCAREGRFLQTLWPPAGADFASLKAEE